MTLIVGVKTKDGIVIGSDGCATFGFAGQPTVRQETVKLRLISGQAVIGVTGPIGMAQRMHSVLERQCTTNLRAKKVAEAMGHLQREFGSEFVKHFELANVLNSSLARWTHTSVLSGSMIAMGFAERAALIQFDHIFAPEEATESNPWVALGSGQSIADPFMAFVRRSLWGDQLPSLADGILGTVWCLRNAIQTNAGGLSDPIQLAVLAKNKKGSFEPSLLPQGELDQSEEAVKDVEKAVGNWKHLRAPTPPIPAVPPQSANGIGPSPSPSPSPPG